MGETELSLAIRKALSVFPGVKLERQQAGTARGGKTRLASSGAADIIGCVRMPRSQLWRREIGRFFSLEVKAPDGKTSPARAVKQGTWGAEIRACGGFYAKVDSVQKAIAALHRCMNGESE